VVGTTLAIELIRTYIYLKMAAEGVIPHPWNDEELKKIVKKKISELRIEDLLNEVVDSGSITCPECEETLLPNAHSCSKCRWENPLVSLNILR